MVELLLSKRADINSRSGYYGCNALAAAAVHGREDIVKRLLSIGADITLVGVACATLGTQDRNYRMILKLILSKGAEVDEHYGGGQYSGALQAAFARGSRKMAEELRALAQLNFEDPYENALEAAEAMDTDLEEIVGLVHSKART